MKDKETIIKEIKEFIKNNGGNYSDWYVGISEEPKKRLQNHNADVWIFRKASSSATAREIENYFIKSIGTDGGPGGGDKDARYVYAYKKKTYTREN